MNLAEYGRSATQLADFLPWAALVDEGIVLNKDGSFQRTARFRGPDLDSAFETLPKGPAVFAEAAESGGEQRRVEQAQRGVDQVVVHSFAANPNLPLIRDLKKAGVEVFVCGQSLHDLGFKAEEVAEEVPVADAAMLVLVNKQTVGYAYIPAP